MLGCNIGHSIATQRKISEDRQKCLHNQREVIHTSANECMNNEAQYQRLGMEGCRKLAINEACGVR
jgi:hypothetical protein